MDNQLEDIIRDIDVEILNKHAYNNNEKQNFIQNKWSGKHFTKLLNFLKDICFA